MNIRKSILRSIIKTTLATSQGVHTIGHMAYRAAEAAPSPTKVSKAAGKLAAHIKTTATEIKKEWQEESENVRRQKTCQRFKKSSDKINTALYRNSFPYITKQDENHKVS